MFADKEGTKMKDDGGISRAEFNERIAKCLGVMKEQDIDVMYVFGDSKRPENLIYLTNYRPVGTDLPHHISYKSIFLLTKDGEATLINDREWYQDLVKEESWVQDIVADSQGDSLGLSFDVLRKRKLLKGRIEVDTNVMPASFYKEFLKRFDGCKIDESSRIVAKLRETKSKKEIELLTKGLEILGKAHDAALAMAKEGTRENDIALEIRRVITNEGGDYPTSLFVDAGPRSTLALGGCPMATNYRLKKGDMVLVSAFCTYKKYTPGIDRNWVVGEPSERQRKLAEIELKTLEKAISLVKPGVKSTDFMKPVYTEFAEPLLREAGFSNYNIQGYIAHGSGIQGEETPYLWKLDSTSLKPNMVIHMEPGIYSKDPKIGGIRTADTIVVTEDGCENITNYPRRIGTLA
jgi:Xaa-Pro aminopeptidase